MAPTVIYIFQVYRYENACRTDAFTHPSSYSEGGEWAPLTSDQWPYSKARIDTERIFPNLFYGYDINGDCIIAASCWLKAKVAFGKVASSSRGVLMAHTLKENVRTT